MKQPGRYLIINRSGESIGEAVVLGSTVNYRLWESLHTTRTMDIDKFLSKYKYLLSED